MIQPPLKSAPWPGGCQRFRYGLGLRAAEFNYFMHSLVSKSKQPLTRGSVAPLAPCKGARGFMIAKPLTSSLKLIIGILQNNLKTCAFCAHSAHSAAGRL